MKITNIIKLFILTIAIFSSQFANSQNLKWNSTTKKFEKTKGWLSQKLSSSNQVDQFANILEERSIWQRYGF